MGLHLPPDVAAKIVHTPECRCVDCRGGREPAKPERVEKPLLVEPAFCPYPLSWTIPLVTASEVNGREWRKRSKRSDAAWSAVSQSLGPKLYYLAPVAKQYHDGTEPVRPRFVRLGGRTLDRSNLPTALKAVEDAVAFMIGADDGNPQWQASWDQEPGGPCGVRIEVL